jgi:hypothetical protein
MRFWFEAAEPFDLAACRIAFFGGLFVFYLGRDISGWGNVSQAFWMPTWLFSRLHLPVLAEERLWLLQSIWKVSLAASALGLLTRVSTATAFLLGFYVLGLPHNFGKIHHIDAVLVIVLAIMAFARCGDALSLDRLLRRSAAPVEAGGEYTWPIRAACMAFALTFFAAGIAKMRAAGLPWIFSDNLATAILQINYEAARSAPYKSWGSVLIEHPWACRVAAGTTVAAELAYPLALFSVRARWVLVPLMISIQTGIRITMGISFAQFMLCNFFWVPWSRLRALIAPSGRTPARLPPEPPAPPSPRSDRPTSSPSSA